MTGFARKGCFMTDFRIQLKKGGRDSIFGEEGEKEYNLCNLNKRL
jgi:hypothetical protein